MAGAGGASVFDRVDSDLSLTLSLATSSVIDPSYVVRVPTSANEWLPFEAYSVGSKASVGFSVQLLSGPTTTLTFDDLVVGDVSTR